MRRLFALVLLAAGRSRMRTCGVVAVVGAVAGCSAAAEPSMGARPPSDVAPPKRAEPAREAEGEALEPVADDKPVESRCAKAAFLAAYVKAGLLRSSSEDAIVLELPVDLHAADCGAPDCYGHRMTMTLELNREGTLCEVLRAKASAVPYNQCGAPDWKAEPWENHFAAQGNPDLADARLGRIELRDPARKEAMLLLPSGYFFYEKVEDSSQLRPALEPEDAKDCCYGYTSSASQWWSVDLVKDDSSDEKGAK